MAKEIKNQEVETVEVETTEVEKTEVDTTEEPKKESWIKRHKKAIITTLASVIAFGVGAGVAYATTKKEPDEESDDVIDSTDYEVEE